jgi:hypothetical protein
MNQRDQQFFDLINKSFSYNPETGEIVRLTRPSNRVHIGDVAGSPDKKGYLLIHFKRSRFKAHRIAWLLTYGEFPDGHLDHINGITNDNRISNLRLATRFNNMANRGKGSNNKSGFKGVYKHSCGNRWAATITANGVFEYIGIFKTPEEAASAYRVRSELLHKEFSNHG